MANYKNDENTYSGNQFPLERKAEKGSTAVLPFPEHPLYFHSLPKKAFIHTAVYAMKGYEVGGDAYPISNTLHLLPYFLGKSFVSLSRTSWLPPSTMEVEETTVSLAFSCRALILIAPVLHIVDRTLLKDSCTLSLRGPA